MSGRELYSEMRCTRCHDHDGLPTSMGERRGAIALDSALLDDIGSSGVRDSIVSGREGMRGTDELSDAELDAIVDYVMDMR